jgi:hypothetical protein
MNRSPKFLTNSSLRVSLKPAAKINYLNLATSKMIKESEIEGCSGNNMKTSGDTAPDFNASHTLSSSHLAENNFIDERILFGSIENERKKPELPVKFNKSDAKFSKFTRFLSPKEEIGQSYFSPKHSKKNDECFSPSYRTEQRL